MNFEPYSPSQAAQIKQLFTDTFRASEGLAEGELIGHLAGELQTTTDPNDLFGFVAKDNDTLAGCIFFSRITFETPINAFILAPVAVAPHYQGRGVGQQLINSGLAYLKQHEVDLVFTYGDPNYYAKVGFQAISETIAKAPLRLTYPEGWLAQALVGTSIAPIAGHSTCVSALNDPRYW